MSSLALMRWLESAPDRYDAGMRWITLGRVERLHQTLAEAAARHPGDRVLEIGCGTGAVTEKLVARGARVEAFDQSPEMLERARRRLCGAGPGSVALLEQTAAEADALEPSAYDAVVASLCLSEMSASERAYVLRTARERLREGGVLAVADEVRPRGAARILHALLRAPQAALAWLLAGSLSRPIPNLAEEIESAGLRVIREERCLAGGLAVLVADLRP